MSPAQIFGDLFTDGGLDFGIREQGACASGGGALDEEQDAFGGIGVRGRDPLLTDNETVDDGVAESRGGEDVVDF